MNKTTPGTVIHKNVALIACDTALTLKETLQRLEDLNISAIQLGERHLALPAQDVNKALNRLKEHGEFPRLIGTPISEEPQEQEVQEQEVQEVKDLK